MKLKPVVASLVMLGLMAPTFAKSSLLSQQAVIDQNSAIPPLCTESWFNRIHIGGMGSIVGIVGNHDPAGTFTNVNNGSDLYVNNFNLIVNANLSNWSKATLNLAYLGAPIPWNNMSSPTKVESYGGADGYPNSVPPTRDCDKCYSFRSIKHSIVADEAYVTIANLQRYPFYLVFGKKYVPFGNYWNPYIPYQIMSPTQMLTQTNAVTAIAGVTTDFGFYGSLFAFRGETYPHGADTGNIRNFGAKIGYYDHLDDFNVPNAHVNFAISYMNNIWDTQTFTPNPETKWSWNERQYSNVKFKQYHPAIVDNVCENKENAIDRVGAVSVHGDFAYKAFSMSANWVGTLQKMVEKTYSEKHFESSKFWAADINADYSFKTFERDSSLGACIQWTGNGAWFGENSYGITDWTRIIPKWRLLGEYKVKLFKNTDLNLVVAHGKSYDFVTNTSSNQDACEPHGGRNTTLGLARLMVQF